MMYVNPLLLLGAIPSTYTGARLCLIMTQSNESIFSVTQYLSSSKISFGSEFYISITLKNIQGSAVLASLLHDSSLYLIARTCSFWGYIFFVLFLELWFSNYGYVQDMRLITQLQWTPSLLVNLLGCRDWGEGEGCRLVKPNFL